MAIYDDSTILEHSNGERSLVSEFVTPIFNSIEKYSIKDSDTLFLISQKFYGTTDYWYILADLNSISDFFELTTGTIIVIPLNV